MYRPTLLQLECFVALVAEGSFAAAAQRLNKSVPAVHAALKGLEDEVRLELLDRSGYRVSLTEAGKSYYAEALRLLAAHDSLARYAAQLASGTEVELRVVIGDLCPLAPCLAPLVTFFTDEPITRPVFLSETIAGPWARLARGEADLAIHHLDAPTPELETIHLFDVELVAVAAPSMLPFSLGGTIEPPQLRAFRQCVIRDSAINWRPMDYHLLEGAPTVSVADQATKRELIVQGLAWGHLPVHMVEDDLRAGRLLTLTGPNLPATILPHFAMRRRDITHGPAAQRLWQRLGQLKQEVGMPYLGIG